MYSIAIITAENSLNRILTIDAEMKKECNITYLQYSSVENLKKVYKENISHFDAFIFSGSYPYDIINQSLLKDNQKPHAYFDLSDRDYYKALAKLSISSKRIDFSRVFIETPDIEIDFNDIFNNENMPIISSPVPQGIYIDSLNELYEKAINFYIDLWKENKIDLVITRYSNLTSLLKSADIPFFYLSASRESMLEVFYKLLTELYLEQDENKTTSFCLISAESGSFSNVQKQKVKDILLQCNKVFGMNFIVQQTDNYFELTTSTAVFKNISNNYTICPVTAYLRENLTFPFCIGWGSAVNTVNAYQNAIRALKESKISINHPAFLVTADNKIIGPLSSKKRITYDDTPDERMIAISKKTGLTPLYLQKILSVLSQKENDDISAEELAYYLSITTRSASRLLVKLVDSGAANVSYNRQLNLRGRPAKIYSIDFTKL